ncbi:MAG TPA: outer membrane protein transport protein [Candidatus Hydrogenedentes bacterium]|nr:outer membrane protein transport protein [Candidatus Hydrogenedentota bacterium]
MIKGFRPLLCNLVLTLTLCGGAGAQLTITSSPNPVGSGARAIGMGGAFIAVADDATAASWNPGGLTQLERPEISFVHDFDFYRENVRSKDHSELNSQETVDLNGVNYLSVAWPIPWTIAGRNLVLSLNYQRKYDFDRDLNFNYNTVGSLFGGGTASTLSKYRYLQRGELAALSPAFGFEITNRISVGAVLNLWYHDILPKNEWEERTEVRSRGLINGVLAPFNQSKLRIEKNYENFDGMNFTVGILVKPTERLSLGAVYHSKLKARVKYTEVVRMSQVSAFPGYTRSVRPLEYDFPSAFGIGIAYRFPGDRLTLSFDVTRREWDEFVIRDRKNSQFSMQKRSGVTGLPKNQSPNDPTYCVRLGAEYVFLFEKKPKQNYLPSLRAGFFYDPEPASNRRRSWFGLKKGSGHPDDFFGVSVGAGLLVHNRVNLDFAYVYRWGDNVRQATFGLRDTSMGVDQHFLYLSTVIYF